MAKSPLAGTGAPDELKKMASQAVQQGWRVERRGSGHLAFLSPNKGTSPVFASATPGKNNRAIPNIRGKLRRAGLRI